MDTANKNNPKTFITDFDSIVFILNLPSLKRANDSSVAFYIKETGSSSDSFATESPLRLLPADTFARLFSSKISPPAGGAGVALRPPRAT
jgi:hypothetical protein